MYYYSFNIGDFDKVTRHLSICERGLFRDLLDLYIKDEKPVTSDLKKLERLLCIKSKSEKVALANVLEDFFVLTDGGYASEFCQDILDNTVTRADASRENGKKGGRPPKLTQSQSIPDEKPNESQSQSNQNLDKTQNKPSDNLEITQEKATHIPNTQYPYTQNTQIPPNPQEQKSGVCEGKTADVLAKAEQICQSNAQDIQNWQAPSLDEMLDMLKLSGFSGTLTQQQYQVATADMKTHFAEQATLGKPIKTDALRKNKLRDWIMRNAKNPLAGKNQPMQYGGANDPMAVNAKWGQNDDYTPTMTAEEFWAEQDAKQKARELASQPVTSSVNITATTERTGMIEL